MKKQLKCIMLVDDNPHDNFFHERVIRKTRLGNIKVVIKHTALEALDYLKLDQDDTMHPGLIFLDINMPGMDGWEFLEEYKLLDKDQQSKAMIIMLTTCENRQEVTRANANTSVSGFITKPLTRDKMIEINDKYFTPFTDNPQELIEVLK